MTMPTSGWDLNGGNLLTLSRHPLEREVALQISSSSPNSLSDYKTNSFLDSSSSRFCSLFTTESPMESSTDDSSYRIPPSVFTPDTPTKAAEWSAASNESLFSIQMGASFTREQFLWRSGELGSPGVTSIPSPTSNGKSAEVGKLEATGDTWDGVSRESENQNKRKSYADVRIAHYSVESEKSFAFPILTGQSDKEGQDSIGRMRSSQELQQQPTSEAAPNQENEPLKSSESKNNQAEPQPAQTTWFSWFSCCTCTTFCS